MSDFTDEDRQRLIEVHTDMRHVKESLNDHETRIRANTKFRNSLLSWVSGAGVLGALAVKAADKLWPS